MYLEGPYLCSTKLLEKPGRRANYGYYQKLTDLDMGEQSDPISDFDFIEAILSCFCHRIDAPIVTRMLLKHFGSFLDMVLATREQLLDAGLDERTIAAFKLVHVASQRVLKQKISALPLLSNYELLQNYLISILAHEKKEQVRILFLDSRNFLLLDECHSQGTINYIQIYPREIIRRAIELNSTAIIVVHNHPSSYLVPSEEDLTTTRDLKRICNLLSITVHDHLIVGRSGMLSLNELGLI